ncbi:MAG: M2 family metallopeptidase [Deltaproteobacteria bacterium]|nr:M2 family metallopeptidase [Deltaproteobacteria bacterium]
MTEKRIHDPIGAAAAFVHDHERRFRPLYVEAASAAWDLATTGLPEHADRKTAAEVEIGRIFADLGAYTRVNSFDRVLREHAEVDPLLRRQVHLLRLAYLEGQIDDTTLAERVALETEIENEFNHHRGRLRGEHVDDNELRRVLLGEDDVALRRDAWLASKEVGAHVAARLERLVRIRNTAARRRGFRDHRALALAVSEIDEAWLDPFLTDLDERTREPYRAMKRLLDATLARRFGVSEGSLAPWHYPDPFFQEPPVSEAARLDPGFRGVDLVAASIATFRAIGLPVDESLKASDLEPRPGKSQHAFCIQIDRERDVRVLANVEPVAYWAGTMLHEFGHAAYDLYVDPALPFMLRCPAHPLTTEAVALLMGRLLYDPAWLEADAGFETSRVAELTEPLRETRHAARLVFARWCLTVIEFERSLYADPDGDLDARWWDVVERFQEVRRPPARKAADWAAKIHLSTNPVYYQNYLIGETLAAQLAETIHARTGRGVFGNPGAGHFLLHQVFRPGASVPWDELVRRATGRPLDPEVYLTDY